MSSLAFKCSSLLSTIFHSTRLRQKKIISGCKSFLRAAIRSGFQKQIVPTQTINLLIIIIIIIIFDSHLNYGNFVWGQNILQKKVLRLMNFKPRNFHTSPLYSRLNVLKLPDKIFLENFLLISKAINNFLPSAL